MRVQPGGLMATAMAVSTGAAQGRPDSDGSNPSISAEGNAVGAGGSWSEPAPLKTKTIRAAGIPRSPAVACPRPRPIEPPMSHDTTIAHRQVEITNSLGLHFRPAQKFVELASRFQADIRVRLQW